jgi:hypothetical protein
MVKRGGITITDVVSLLDPQSFETRKTLARYAGFERIELTALSNLD